MMLAQAGSEVVLKSKNYIFEPKLDGYRTLLICKSGKIRLLSRNGLNVTGKYPEINLKLSVDCVIDGEVVIFDEKGNPSFSAMQNRQEDELVTFVAFDIIELKGRSLRSLPLLERKKILAKTIRENDRVKIMFFTENGPALWDQMVSRKLEGVIAKKKDSIYIDRRSSDWLKIKSQQTADCVIMGYTKKIRDVSSLALGLYDRKDLVYSGKVGTGFSESFLAGLKKKMKDIKAGKIMPADARDVNLVKPVLVCEIKYLQFTNDGRFRAPVFLRLRDDKLPKECTIDQVK